MEEEAIRLANKLISSENRDLNYQKFEEDSDALISSTSGYISYRLENLEYSLIDDAKARKGLLIYGEGGIGKTYFPYKLAQKLKAKHMPFLAAFN